MKIIGITGGIATGKTTICNFLEKQKFPLHDSDRVVKNIYTKAPRTLLVTLNKIGLSRSFKNKTINKNIIRDEIFKNKTKKKTLEKYFHNEVRKSREKFIKKHKAKKTKAVILDIPLLFEARLSNVCDYIILLYAPQKTKIKRAIKRKAMSKKMVLKILKSQLSDAYKRKRSHYVINTTKTKKHSFKTVLKIINDIIYTDA